MPLGFGLSTLVALVVVATAGVGGIVYGASRIVDQYRKDEPDAEELRALADWLSTPFGRAYRAAGVFVGELWFNLTRVMPLSKRFWRGLSMFALTKWYRKTGADAIGIEGTDETKTASLTPIKWFDGSEDEDREPGWKASGKDRYWQASKHGGPVRVGKVPLMALDRDEARAGTLYESRVTEAIDQGATRPLLNIEGAELSADVTLHDQTGAGQQAMADGGVSWVRNGFEAKPRSQPIFEDAIVDLSSSEGYDGQAISFFSYANTDPMKTAPEVVDQAEKRGEAAARLGGDGVNHKKIILYALLGAGLIVAASNLPAILEFFAGGSGGGGSGGSAIPSIMISALGVF